jgi:hypothetical protein
MTCSSDPFYSTIPSEQDGSHIAFADAVCSRYPTSTNFSMCAHSPSSSPRQSVCAEPRAPLKISPDVDKFLDQASLPRFTFFYPELILQSCSESARAFLPPTGPVGKAAHTLPSDTNLPDLRFDQCFSSTQEPSRLTGKGWVDDLLSDCAHGGFGQQLTLKPHYYLRACTATLFLASTWNEGAKVLQVVLLSPVNPPSTVVQQSIRKGTMVEERNPAALEDDGKGPLTAEQLDYILMRSAKGTLDPTKGRKELTAEELRSLFDYLPVCAFVTSLEGHVDYFNKAWYDYVGMRACATVFLVSVLLIHLTVADLQFLYATQTGL